MTPVRKRTGQQSQEILYTVQSSSRYKGPEMGTNFVAEQMVEEDPEEKNNRDYSYRAWYLSEVESLLRVMRNHYRY